MLSWSSNIMRVSAEKSMAPCWIRGGASCGSACCGALFQPEPDGVCAKELDGKCPIFFASLWAGIHVLPICP